jgi:uncharacterized protein YecE (DUF72 family)
VHAVRIGCSGWNYADWRGRVYPKGCPPSRWLEHYATLFDTVEVNSTFYRLARRDAVERWVTQVPEDFVFAVKGSRYLTHMKRLTDMAQGVERFYERIEPLVRTPMMGPVLWQLPGNFQRDDERLASAIDSLNAAPPTRHTFEFRHPSWFTPDVYALLRERDVALTIGDDPRRPFQADELTADFSFLRYHYGHRGRNGNYSESELDEQAQRIRGLARHADVFVYLNNDWCGYAPRNAKGLLRRLRLEPYSSSAPGWMIPDS